MTPTICPECGCVQHLPGERHESALVPAVSDGAVPLVPAELSGLAARGELLAVGSKLRGEPEQ